MSYQATERFFRVATELVVEACLKSGRVPPPSVTGDKTKVAAKQLSYPIVDVYVKLLLVLVIVLLIRLWWMAFIGASFCYRERLLSGSLL